MNGSPVIPLPLVVARPSVSFQRRCQRRRAAMMLSRPSLPSLLPSRQWMLPWARWILLTTS